MGLGAPLRRAAAYYGALAAVAALLLAAQPPLRDTPLKVPVGYSGDGLFFTVLVKGIREDGPFHLSRIGAPFGSSIVDWPVGMWLPFGIMASLAAVTGEPGTAVNLYWLGSMVAASAGAAWALRRLRVDGGLAFVLGILYGLLPYAFYRNVSHINLAFPFVPLVALLCLRVAGTRPEDDSRSESAITLAACAAQGICYVYYSFFACLFLAAAIPLGWWRTRQGSLVRRGAAAILILSAGTAAMILPSAVYWRRHGTNTTLDYKTPGEADTFGLKLRHLVTPVADHPVAPLRAIAGSIASAEFPGENENVSARLGTVGALGLVSLLAFLVGRAAGIVRARDEDVDGAAALLLVGLLVAQVGGFGSLFSVFVTPDIRAFNRIVVFLAFFSLFAAAVLLGRGLSRLGLGRRLPAWVRLPSLVALLVFGIRDQVPLAYLAAVRAGSAEEFAEDRRFTRSLEGQLPRDALVFQLPHGTIPVDPRVAPPMQPYDPGRAYLHSRSLHWSWGAVAGRHQDWATAVSGMPPADMVQTLAVTGFSGVWIDRRGYDGTSRARFDALETELAALAGRPLVASRGGRYSFVSLEDYRRRLADRASPEQIAARRSQLLEGLPVRWREGCSEERPHDDGWWRSCGRSAGFVLRNASDRDIAVTLTARLRTEAAGPATVRVRGGGFDETVPVGALARGYRREVALGASERTRVRLDFEGRGACPEGRNGLLCFELGDLQVSARPLPGPAHRARRRNAGNGDP